MIFVGALLLAATPAQSAVPPCRNGAANCQPWERAWGSFYLILKWGPGAPLAIKYDSLQSCERAADAVGRQRSNDKQTTIPLTMVEGPNIPWAFCIPA